jgi:hypothetical protein
MDVGDSGEFGRRLITLGELFDLKLAATRQALYFEALRDLPFEVVIQALNQAVKVCTFFPKPAELRKFAVGDNEDQAELAWMALSGAMRAAGGYASVLLDDPALGETIVAVFGGWPQACAMDLSPEMWASKRKEFGRVYRVLRDRGLTGVRYLPGICEQQNDGRAEWMQYVPIKRLGSEGVQTLTRSEAEAALTLGAALENGVRRLEAET